MAVADRKSLTELKNLSVEELLGELNVAWERLQDLLAANPAAANMSAAVFAADLEQGDDGSANSSGDDSAGTSQVAPGEAQRDVDALLNGVDSGDVDVAAVAPAPQAEGGGVTANLIMQDEFDALLASNKEPPKPFVMVVEDAAADVPIPDNVAENLLLTEAEFEALAPVAPTATTRAAPPSPKQPRPAVQENVDGTPVGDNVGQNEIDQLFAQTNKESAITADNGPEGFGGVADNLIGQDEFDALLEANREPSTPFIMDVENVNTLSGPPENAAERLLLNQVEFDELAEAAKAPLLPAPKPVTEPAGGNVGQSEIDALLAATTDDEPAPGGNVGQSEIDALLAATGDDGTDTEAAAPEANGGQNDIDALFANASEPQTEPVDTASQAPMHGMEFVAEFILQEELDLLLQHNEAPGDPFELPVTLREGDISRPESVAKNLLLTDVEFVELKVQMAAPCTGALQSPAQAPPAEDTLPASVSQDDIDALLAAQ